MNLNCGKFIVSGSTDELFGSPLARVPFLLIVAPLESHWRTSDDDRNLAELSKLVKSSSIASPIPSLHLGVPADLEVVGGGGGGQKKVSL